jgi:hypothetical protein
MLKTVPNLKKHPEYIIPKLIEACHEDSQATLESTYLN